MKRNELLYDLFQAYFDARRNKRNTHNQLRFEMHFESHLFQLYEDIMERRYEINPSICFVIDKPVTREIFAADFRDRVIHHLIFNYINPLLEQQFITDSYSCRKTKGTLYGIRRCESFIKECSNGYTGSCYILQIDISGYFMSINRKILKQKIIKMLAPYHDKQTGLDFDLIYYLLDEVLENDPTINCKFKGHPSDWQGVPRNKSLFYTPKDCGLPIGNLTSQLFSNVYLHDFDLFVKDTLKMEYYGRYVDDAVFVHADKEVLKETLSKIRAFLREEFELDIHPNKVYLQHYSKGISFLGAYIKPGRTYIRNRTKKKFIHAVETWDRICRHGIVEKEVLPQMRATLNSYLGIMKHHKTYRLKRKIIYRRPRSFFKYGYFGKSLEVFFIKKKYLDNNGLN